MNPKISFPFALAAFLALSACSKAQAAKPEPKVFSKVEMQLTHIHGLQAAKLIASQPETIVLDIRTAGEYARSHIKGAINIEYDSMQFPDNLRSLDKAKPYLIYCRSGARSTRSLAIFKQEGFTNIIHMDGGLITWNASGLPLVQ